MFKDVIEERIKEYNPQNEIEQENVLQEIIQYYILAGFSKTGFFSHAEFHGGTFLRIIHGLDRFSEDLDFLLKKPNKNFKWSKYLEPVLRDLRTEGLEFDVKDRHETNVKKVFLKTDSIGKVISVNLPVGRASNRKIKIKLEIDANPPKGSESKTHYIDFPTIAPITAQVLESSFSLKSHALLCRNYVKGRDWYDFFWYCSKKAKLNFRLLQNALIQAGPWENKKIKVDLNWYMENMRDKIISVDWKAARDDVMRFIPTQSQFKLDQWNTELFLYQLGQMEKYINY